MISICLVIPLWIIALCIFFVGAVAVTIIIIVPFYILSIFVFFRMIYWWNKKRLVLKSGKKPGVTLTSMG